MKKAMIILKILTWTTMTLLFAFAMNFLAYSWTANLAQAQTSPSIQSSSLNSTNGTHVLPSSPTKLPGIKITSPLKGQPIPLSKNLTITGTSTDNASPTSDCKVAVIMNGIKPYQEAIPTGSHGPQDYSNWSFTPNTKYAAIKEGQNKITSKIACQNSITPVNLTKFYSVNFTGLADNNTQKRQQQQQQSANLSQNATSGILSPAVSSPKVKPLKVLAIDLKLGKDPVIRGDTQDITVMVHNANSTGKVIGANVIGHIFNPSGSSKKEFGGKTDQDGLVTYSWKIGGKGKSSTYQVDVNASAIGYENKTTTDTFKVKPLPASAPPAQAKNNNSHSRIPEIRIPEIRIPDIVFPSNFPFG
jgi:hypothetical protein